MPYVRRGMSGIWLLLAAPRDTPLQKAVPARRSPKYMSPPSAH